MVGRYPIYIWLRHDRGMGNTMCFRSWVCMGTGTDMGLLYPCKTVPLPTGLWVFRYWISSQVSGHMTLLIHSWHTFNSRSTTTPPTTAVSNCSWGGNREWGQQVSNHNDHNMAQTTRIVVWAYSKFFGFISCFCKLTDYVSSFSGSKLLVTTDDNN